MDQFLILYKTQLPDHPSLQDFLEKTNAKDASGNAVLGDIGVYLQQEVSGSPVLLCGIVARYTLNICNAC